MTKKLKLLSLEESSDEEEDKPIAIKSLSVILKNNQKLVNKWSYNPAFEPHTNVILALMHLGFESERIYDLAQYFQFYVSTQGFEAVRIKS